MTTKQPSSESNRLWGRDPSPQGFGRVSRVIIRKGWRQSEVITYWLLGKILSFGVAIVTWAVLRVRHGQHQSVLQSLVHYDSLHYLHISLSGYVTGEPTAAFYPLYPLLIRLLRLCVFRGLAGYPGAITASLLITGIASLAAIICLDRVCRRYMDDASRRLCVLLWALGPTAVFLSVGYTEALFCALVLGAILRLQRFDWFGAGTLIALSCLARPVGILAYIMMPISWWQYRRTAPVRSGPLGIIGLGLPPIALAAHLWYQQIVLGDALASIRTEQTVYHQHALAPWLLPGFLAEQTAVTNTAYQIMIAFNFSYLCVAVVLSALVFASRRLPIWLKVYTALVLLSILCRSSEMSMPRLLMIAFPLLMCLSEWVATGPSTRARCVLALSILMNVIGTILFLTERCFF
jgi:Gpi18-like mannosyltransferase